MLVLSVLPLMMILVNTMLVGPVTPLDGELLPVEVSFINYYSGQLFHTPLDEELLPSRGKLYKLLLCSALSPLWMGNYFQ